MQLYRIRNIIIAAVLIIAAYVVQWSIFSRIPLWGYAPNLMLLITFTFGYTSGKVQGMLAGLFSGLLVDIFFCEVLGYNALVLLVLGFTAGIWESYFYSDDLYVPMIILMGSEAAYRLVYFLIWHVLHSRFDIGHYLLYEALPEFLLTFIAGILLFKPLSALLKWMDRVPEQ